MKDYDQIVQDFADAYNQAHQHMIRHDSRAKEMNKILNEIIGGNFQQRYIIFDLLCEKIEEWSSLSVWDQQVHLWYSILDAIYTKSPQCQYSHPDKVYYHLLYLIGLLKDKNYIFLLRDLIEKHAEEKGLLFPH